MKLTLTIDMDGTAFKQFPALEAANVLESAARKLRNDYEIGGACEDGDTYKLFDALGMLAGEAIIND